MTNELVNIEKGNVPTIAKFDGLIQWVVEAPVEDVCWRITELGTMRKWVAAQKAATDLRIKAVRLELIALRKVALGGLVDKISGAATLRASARWLAKLSDEEFATVLSELDGEKTPIALYQRQRAEAEAMREALRDKSNDASNYEVWRARHLGRDYDFSEENRRRSATSILEEIIEVGEPFTVSEAAERLADALGLDIDVRRQTADGLREMIRTSIRRGDRSVKVDEWSSLPTVFTVALPSGEYVRVPATSATIANLRDHWIEVSQRALAATQRAEELGAMLDRVTFEALDLAPGMDIGDDPDAVMDFPLAPVIDSIRSAKGWRDAVEDRAA